MEMTEEKKGLNSRTLNAIGAGVLLLAIALGIVLYTVTGDVFDALWTVLIVFGVYMGASSALRGRNTDSFGPSEADVTVVGGTLLAGIGLAGLVYSMTGEVLYTVVIIIVIVAVVGIIMAIKNRNV